MQDSHTTPTAADLWTALAASPLALASSATAGLPAAVAGRVEGHLASFARHMTQGLLAACTAVGLEVMADLVAAEVGQVAGPRAATTRSGPPPGMASSTAR